MCLFRHRLWPGSPLFAIFSLLLTTGFVLQMRVLYNTHLKQHRLHEYKLDVKELAQNLEQVVRIANRTSDELSRLQNVVNKTLRKITLKGS